MYSILSVWALAMAYKRQDQDEDIARRRHNRRNVGVLREEDPAVIKAKLRKTVLGLISRGQTGRARQRILSHGVARMSDPTVKDAMISKYPPRSHDFPDSVILRDCVDSLPGLKENLLNLYNK